MDREVVTSVQDDLRCRKGGRARRLPSCVHMNFRSALQFHRIAHPKTNGPVVKSSSKAVYSLLQVLRLEPPIWTAFGLAISCFQAYGREPAATSKRQLLGEQPDGGVLVSTNQIVTPIGKVQGIDGARPKDLAVSPDGKTVAVLTTSKVLLFTPEGALKATVTVKPGPLGLAWHPDGETVYCSGEGGTVYRVQRKGEAWKATTLQALDPSKKVKVFSPPDASPPSDAKEISGPRKKGDPQV